MPPTPSHAPFEHLDPMNGQLEFRRKQFHAFFSPMDGMKRRCQMHPEFSKPGQDAKTEILFVPTGVSVQQIYRYIDV